MKRIGAFAAATAAALVLLSASGCYRQELPEDQQWHWDLSDWDTDASVTTDSREFPLGGAERIDVEIAMDAGVLELGNTDTAALEAEFVYRPTVLEPTATYSVEGTVGSVSVEQPSRSDGPFRAYRNEWDLKFAEGVPIDMRVSLGAGESVFDFSSLDLRDLDVQLGAGNVLMDFSGDRSEDVSARIEAGVGALTLLLPEDVGVRVTRVQSGIGAIEVDDGLTREGDAYVNDAYGTSPVTIDISIESGVGATVLETVP